MIHFPEILLVQQTFLVNRIDLRISIYIWASTLPFATIRAPASIISIPFNMTVVPAEISNCDPAE
jgi:hypothetical protein